VRIDDFLPEYDVIEHHDVRVDADAETTFDAFRRVDLARSLPVRALFAVRALPRLLLGRQELTRRLNLDEAMSYGFVLLTEDRPHELVFGSVGRFWRPRGGMRSVTATEFGSFDEPGFAKAALNFYVEPFDVGCNVVTETRVLCLDERARRAFMAYWTLIRPFSVYIRGVLLGEIKRTAESLHRAI
jgi:hypothetical protein